MKHFPKALLIGLGLELAAENYNLPTRCRTRRGTRCRTRRGTRWKIWWRREIVAVVWQEVWRLKIDEGNLRHTKNKKTKSKFDLVEKI